MKRAHDIEFELPDDLVIGGADDDADGRQGAGSTLPQDLFPLGLPTGGADTNTGRGHSLAHASTQPMSPADGDTLPADLAPATGAVSLPQEALPQAIVAPINPRGRSPQDGPQPKRVLVVDDDLTVRLYMRSRLMLRGNVHLHEAASGEEALRLVQAQRFDAVLLDVDMGQQNGYETCRAVRSFVRREGGKQPRIYIITSRSSMIDKMRARMAGADAFLSKPPFPAELAALLEDL